MTILQLENLSLQYNGSNKPILNNLNFQVQQGDFIILLGNNGSGKSSLLQLISNSSTPTSGQIIFLNKSLTAYSEKKISKEIVILTQNCSDSFFSSLTLYENYLLKKQTTLQSTTVEKNFLQDYLYEFNPNLSDKLNCPVRQLSGGEAQAFALALSLLHPPVLLLLDEHTSALDPKTSEQIMELTQRKINQYHITCILTTHNLDIAMRYGNRIVFLREGTIHKIINQEEKNNLTIKDSIASYY